MEIKVKYPEWIVKTCEEIIELRMTQRWIPISERLPEDRRVVLATDGESVLMASYADRIYYPPKFYCFGWSVLDGECLGLNWATHWMEIPEPPK